MLERVGVILLFFGNFAAGMIAILALRVVTRGRFLYLTTNEMETLLGFSLLQGLTFQWCRESSMRWPR